MNLISKSSINHFIAIAWSPGIFLGGRKTLEIVMHIDLGQLSIFVQQITIATLRFKKKKKIAQCVQYFPSREKISIRRK